MRTGVVLLNMGGPESLSDVRPFLYNLFSDRDIIRLGPALLQKPIAWFIAKKRAPKSSKLYQQIGGGTPLTKITALQAEALARLLQQQGEYFVTVAMRYWHPFADKAIEQLKANKVDRIILLPLYPHYSKATSGSSLKDFTQQLAKDPSFHPAIHIIEAWPDQQQYVSCLVKKIEEGLSRFDTGDVKLVYSAHSLPVSFIEQGDPYVEHLKRTITAIEQQTCITGTLCYQSRSGPVEWLSPSTSATIAQMAQNGVKNILVVPLSFVSDHVETLYEIAIMFKEEARILGCHLEMTEGLNDTPLFIEALRNLVLQQ